MTDIFNLLKLQDGFTYVVNPVDPGQPGDTVIDIVGRLWINIEECFHTVALAQSCWKVFASNNPDLNLPKLPSLFFHKSYTEEELKREIKLALKEGMSHEMNDEHCQLYINNRVSKYHPKPSKIELEVKEVFNDFDCDYLDISKPPFEGMVVKSKQTGVIDTVKFYSSNSPKEWQWVLLEKIRNWHGPDSLTEVVYNKSKELITNNENHVIVKDIIYE